jgi:hypothetical protein
MSCPMCKSRRQHSEGYFAGYIIGCRCHQCGYVMYVSPTGNTMDDMSRVRKEWGQGVNTCKHYVQTNLDPDLPGGYRCLHSNSLARLVVEEGDPLQVRFWRRHGIVCEHKATKLGEKEPVWFYSYANGRLDGPYREPYPTHGWQEQAINWLWRRVH